MAYLRLAVLVAKHEACTVAAKDLTNADKDFVALRRNGAPQVDETGERFSLDTPWPYLIRLDYDAGFDRSNACRRVRMLRVPSSQAKS